MIGASILFILGYFGIIFEHRFFDKAATAILTGVLCWILYFLYGEGDHVHKAHELSHHLADISQVVFFIIGAMLIVEVIDSHKGFQSVEKILNIRSKTTVFWLILFGGFFLSSVLDNLTTLIVMISILKRIIPERESRIYLSAALVAVVNAGGAWTPIGDITTTMLWIADRISTAAVVQSLFIPCVFTTVVLGLCIKNKVNLSQITLKAGEHEKIPYSFCILVLGLGALIAVPLLKALIGLPPFMGILLGVGVLWAFTDSIHSHDDEKKHLRIQHILSKIDFSVSLFFLGILLAVDALEAFGVLSKLADWVRSSFPSENVFAFALGLLSSVVDNVPLVAATIRMFGLEIYPQDHPTWNMLAYCVGVGGSILVVGSAPGIALMSLEKVSFSWYFKNISLAALISYILGALIAALF